MVSFIPTRGEKTTSVDPKFGTPVRVPLYLRGIADLSEYIVSKPNSLSKPPRKNTAQYSGVVCSTPNQNRNSITPVSVNRRLSASSVESSFSLKKSNRKSLTTKILERSLRDDDNLSMTSVTENSCLFEDESLILETSSIRLDLTTSSNTSSLSTGFKFSCPNPLECYKYGPKCRACRYCKSGPMEYSAYARHLRKAKHKENKVKIESRYSEDMHRERETRCIIFTGFLRDTAQEGFVSHLYSFGMVDYTFTEMDEYSMDEPTLIVEMDTVEDAVDAIKFSNLHYCGFRLKPRKLETEDEVPMEVRASEELLRILTTCSENKTEDRESILDPLVTKIMMTPAEKETKMSIMSDLEKYLRKFYPAVKCTMFGSSATGLAMMGSNLNIHVDIGPSPFNKPASGCPVVVTGEVVREVAEYLEAYTLVKHVVYFSTSRLPSVSFIDVKSLLPVDLVFWNCPVLLSTRVIQLYLDLHPVVRPYLALIRVWAQGNHLINSKRQFECFSSYTMTMLALFFLMRKVEEGKKRSILPRINRLLKNGRVRVNTAPPVDCGCCSLLPSSRLPTVSCSLHPVQLLKDFLKFYSTFQFKSFIISPATGKMIPKLAFLKLFPSFQTKSFAVQDPFVLTSNLTLKMMARPLLRFRYLCELGHKNLDDVLSKNADVFVFFIPSHMTPTEKPSEEEITQEISSMMNELKLNST